ncbi:MAG: hypothetical protein V1861_07175 [Candidatus Micrarchaeota archaeon]
MSKLFFSRGDVASRLAGLDSPKHKDSLASRIAGKTPAEEMGQRLDNANAVIAALRKSGVSSFFAAEHAKLFINPESAVRERGLIVSEFEVAHGLSAKQAAKMADCVIFTAAKGTDFSQVGRIKTMASVALGEGVPFTSVADATYYAPVSVTPEDFARRCVATALKQGKPLDVSEVFLSTHIIAGLVAAGY